MNKKLFLIFIVIYLVGVPMFFAEELDFKNNLAEFSVLSSKEANLAPGKYLNREDGSLMIVQDRGSENLDLISIKGYIVEFEEEPLAVKDKELRNLAQENEEKISKMSNLNPLKYGYILFSTRNEDVPGELRKHKGKMEDQKKSVEKKISDKLEKSITGNVVSDSESIEILSEYENVLNAVFLDISEEESKNIEGIDGVKKVHKNQRVDAVMMDSIPLVNADDVWQMQDSFGNNLTGEGMTIAIIDTGIDYTHADLGGCFGPGCKVEDGFDFVNYDTDPMDDHYHGTHCAGIAAGNGVLNGIAPDAKLYAYKVLNSNGVGSFDQVISGIEAAVDPNNDGNFSDKVDVMSLSLGGPGNPDDPVSIAIDNAVESGVIAVVAAGNEGDDYETIRSPATARKAITVGATYKKYYSETPWDSNPQQNDMASFSSRGPVEWANGKIVKPDIVAPGAIICSARYDNVFPDGEDDYYKPCLDQDHVQLAGTSMATPMVAAAAALLKQKNPDWTPEEIKIVLRNSAVDLGEELNIQGYGLLDLEAAINLDKPVIAEIQTTGVVSGIDVDVIGTAKGDNFQNYTLFYRKESETTWIELCSLSEQKDDEVLCNFDFRGLEETDYLFKLEVYSLTQTSVDHGYIIVENTRIIYPRHIVEDNGDWWDYPEILPTWKNITINGTSSEENFQYYTLELCLRYIGPCLPDAIILENNGDSEVVRGKLGEIDMSQVIESGFYELILTTYYSGGQSIDNNLLYIETDLLYGWPVKRNLEGFGIIFSFLDQPTIADINNDGTNDIITAYNDVISIVNHDATPLSGWPVIINASYGIMQKGPAVGDLDNDGYNEIVVGDNAGYIHVLNHDGSYVFEPKDLGGYLDVPVLEDLNNDGNLEIIVGDWGSNLHVIDVDGNYLPGWPRYLSGPAGNSWNLGLYHPPSVADINNNGNKEIVTHVTACNSFGSCGYSQMASKIWVLDYLGNILSGWPKSLDVSIHPSNIVLANINKDDQIEIIAGSSGDEFYVWDVNGNNVGGWPIQIDTNPSGAIMGEPAIGDINNDDKLEILFTGQNIDYDGCVHAYSTNGQPLENFPVCRRDYGIDTDFSKEVVIADIDSDPEKEIVTQMRGWGSSVSEAFLVKFYAINHDGTIVNGFPKFLDYGGFNNVAPIVDLDNDGDNELIVETQTGNTFIYDLLGDSENYDWNVYRYDSRHTGYFDKNLKPESKIVNDEGYDVQGFLRMFIGKRVNETWQTKRVVIDEEVIVPAKGLLRLDEMWNNENVSALSGGFYQVAARFDVLGEQLLKAGWVFSVEGVVINCTDTDVGPGHPFGRDYSIQGSTTNVHMGTNYWEVFEDVCLKDNQQPIPGQENILFEAYCLGDFTEGRTLSFDCPNGCDNGACVEQNASASISRFFNF